jgi:L-ascorbate metabolism protein UlaG (beta-lactamase superfamily)
MDDIRFCHLGDLGHLLTDRQVQEIGQVDVLFVPVGGVFTIDGAQAQELVRRMSPRVAIPMHFRVGGLSLSIHNADEFLSGLPEDRVVRVGNEVEFEKEELPESTEYWVFSL